MRRRLDRTFCVTNAGNAIQVTKIGKLVHERERAGGDALLDMAKPLSRTTQVGFGRRDEHRRAIAAAVKNEIKPNAATSYANGAASAKSLAHDARPLQSAMVESTAG